MTDHETVAGSEPEDLDGHTIEELTEYLERERQPADPSIDGSEACQHALAALERLRSLARAYLDDDDGGEASPAARSWVAAVLAAIPIETRAGRRFPVPGAGPDELGFITEGTVRGIVRSIGDDLPGMLVGAVRLGADEPIGLAIDVALVYGVAIPDAVTTLRSVLRSLLPARVPFAIGAIDVRVIGIIEPAEPGAAG